MGKLFGSGWGRGILAACLLAGASVCTAQVDEDPLPLSERLVPSSELTPEQVVQIQLDALRLNDARNRGIEVAFRFASPDNKLHTGPLPRFISMMQAGPYRLMLAYESVAFDPVEVVDDFARQRVTLIGSGAVVVYEFYLSRQTQGACVGCWLTDAVVAKRPSGLQV
jgi:hypothetical protein